ncbi:MAG: hypothetical protein JXR72_03100 [Proteobacteria bacterium]|nr:hypothetical protein [Pseudomonadota bacterium]
MIRNRLIFGLVVMIAVGALMLGGCGDGNGGDDGDQAAGGGEVTGTSTTPGEDLTEIAERVDAVLELGYNTITPDTVAKRLFNDNPDDDPFIVDTREPEDYAAGHIPGAINIPLQELPQALLDGTSEIPDDQEVVVASYWGDDGDLGILLINIARIEDPAAQLATPTYPKAFALFQGMTSWSFRRDLVPAGTRFDDALAAGVTVEKATVPGAVPGISQGLYPDFEAFPSDADTVIEKILIRAHLYLNSVPDQRDLHVYPTALAENLEDGDPTNDPQILSVRGGAADALGVIPGALGIPYKDVAVLANSGIIDPTRDTVVYCFTGHTGGLATMSLGILGYPVKNLLYGMNGWSTNTAISSGQLKNFDLLRGWDFPINDGGEDDLTSLADYVPPAGCAQCHTSLTAIFYDREVADPPPAAAAPPSTGEG